MKQADLPVWAKLCWGSVQSSAVNALYHAERAVGDPYEYAHAIRAAQEALSAIWCMVRALKGLPEALEAALAAMSSEEKRSVLAAVEEWCPTESDLVKAIRESFGEVWSATVGSEDGTPPESSVADLDEMLFQVSSALDNARFLMKAHRVLDREVAP